MTGTDLELSTAQNGSGQIVDPRSMSHLTAWDFALQKYAAYANEIADTEFVPVRLRRKPAAITACLMTGYELGIGPMASLRHIQMVEGTPSLSAEYKRARILEAGHDFELVELDKLRCEIRARRRGTTAWTAHEYTIQDAKEAGLVKPRGAWMTRRRRMLFARCSSDIADMLFSDVVNGLPTAELVSEEYALGEFNESGGGDFAAPETEAEKPKTVRRRRAPKAEPPEPETDEAEAGAVAEKAEENVAEGPARRGAAAPAPATASSPAENTSDEEDGFAEEDWAEADDENSEPEPDNEPEQPEEEIADAEEMITEPQHKKIEAHLTSLRIKDRDEVHRVVGMITGWQVDSLLDITMEEAGAVIDVLSTALTKDNPRAALRKLLDAAVQQRENED